MNKILVIVTVVGMTAWLVVVGVMTVYSSHNLVELIGEDKARIIVLGVAFGWMIPSLSIALLNQRTIKN